MTDDKIINHVIKIVLDHDVKPGDHAGGSGHLSYVSYEVKNVLKEDILNNVLNVKCTYDKTVVSEFTIEPYNPPYVYSHEKLISIIDCTDFIADDIPSEIPSNGNFERQILRYIDYYLLKIEQEYGDCRAPVRFPPYFHSVTPQENPTRYYAFIDVDLGDDETLAFISMNQDSMLPAVKKILKERFGMAF